MHKIFTLQLVLLLSLKVLYAQENTVGLIYNTNEAFDGYTLFSPAGNTTVYLINNEGMIVHEWVSEHPPGNAVYLMEDGSLYRAGRTDDDRIRAGGAGGLLEKFDWNGNLLWSYENSTATSRAHHDFQVLPNGNVLILVWEQIEESEVLAAGRNPEIFPSKGLWPESILEINPLETAGEQVVWEWHAWDHLIQNFDDTKANYGVVSDNLGKIDLNYIKPEKDGSDWHHANSINYNADLDQIMISVLNFDEIWIIDHNTTTEEAKEVKGDLLFRWGNPFAYQKGTYDDRLLFGQHNAHWIPYGVPDQGKIMIFNNGRDRPAGEFTSVVKINPVILTDGSYQRTLADDYAPTAYDYEYVAKTPTDFYSWYISGAQQLPNGHLLINDGAHGTFFEINEQEEIVWEYINPIVGNGPLEQGQVPVSPSGDPINAVFRALKYGTNFPAFLGRDMSAKGFVEKIILDVLEDLSIAVYPNPTADWLYIRGAAQEYKKVRLVNQSGQLLKETEIQNGSADLSVSDLQSGVYHLIFNDKTSHRVVVN